MVQVSFSGSGTQSIENLVGKGQGLKVGFTQINFDTGKIQLNNVETIGHFRNLKSKNGISNTVKSFAFKSTAKCVLEYQDTFIDYNLINEWIILNEIETDLISIVREATGLTSDIFDFSFIASDKSNFSLSIEKGTRDSELETVFASTLRAVDTYTQTINVQGAKKILFTGKAISGAGTVTITCEILDPVTNTWIEHIPVEDIFTLINGETKRAQIGDTISRYAQDENIRVAWAQLQTPLATSGIGEVAGIVLGEKPHLSGAVASNIGFILPSGDSLFRIKAVVSVDTLEFSLGLIKVFD